MYHNASVPRGDTVMGVDDTTKKRIDDWIKKEGRNEYGDPRDTVYAGGNPLFDERSAKLKDRYDYILDKHPELKKNGK